MTLTTRVSVLALTAFAAALFGTAACNDSNPAAPGTDTSAGGSSSSGAGGATATGVGGATDTGSGGAVTGAGGDTAAAGGATAAAGGAATTGCNFPATSPPLPAGGTLCDGTVKKGGACTVEGAVCFKTCGPTNTGWKSETCTNLVYAEVSACVWTGTDYSAFRIPASLAELSATCPDTTPQAGQPCTVEPCVVCTDKTTGGYLDSGGGAKSGWCLCNGEANKAWTCGTAGTAWPCTAPGVGATGC